MDSLTQIVLGAGVGEVLMGRKIGYKAQLIGAIAGTVPDLDVLTNFWVTDVAEKLHIHRSYSHALFVHIFLALPFAYVTYRIFKRAYSFSQFYWLWFLGLTTHAILDSFTTYGTQLFLPFTDYLVGFNNISVVDPLYTLPFMALLIACLFYKKDSSKRYSLAKWSFIVSSSYMLLTFGIKYYVHSKIEKELLRQELPYTSISTSPTIFNSILWAGIVDADSVNYITDYSIFQKSDHINFVKYQKNDSLLKGYEGSNLNTLLWFSQGKYFIDKLDETHLNFYIIKWGRQNFVANKASNEKEFVFYYNLEKKKNTTILSAIEPKIDRKEFANAFKQLWKRMMDN